MGNASEPEFGEAVSVAEGTSLVVGRPMDMPNAKADVANVVLHRAGTTLFMIDSGATEDFRKPLRDAIAALGEIESCTLINTHGHPDHVGCNGLVEELGVPFEHYVSQADLEMMRDAAGYFGKAFGDAGRYLPLPFPADVMAGGMEQMFGKLDTRVDAVATLESLRMSRLDVGSLALAGWSFGDGDVFVIPTRGHTAGEAIVLFPKLRLLYTADETTGFYPIWPDSDPARQFHALTLSRELVASGEVAAYADGHHFHVLDTAAASDFLAGLVDGYFALDEAVHATLAGGGATVFEIRDALADVYAAHGLHGEAENKLFGGMQVLRKLAEIGAVETGDDPKQAIFTL